MTGTELVLFAIDVVASLAASVACYAAWTQRDRCRRLRAQIGDERVAAADEQSRMIAVATAECGYDVAWKMLEAAAARRSYELAREIVEDVAP